MPNQISKDKQRANILIRKDLWAAAKEAAAKHDMSLNAWVAYAISRELGSENGYQSVEAVLAATNPQTWKQFAEK